MIRVTRTVIVRSAKLPRKAFRVFIGLEGMYRKRAKSFLKLKKLSLAKKYYPEVRRIIIWLDDHLWKTSGLTLIRIVTHKGWVITWFEPHKQYWKYVNRGWKLTSEAKVKLDKRNRQLIIYNLCQSS
ncbi:MAG: hypothetical protein F7B61_06400 [Caldisphaeraceae archaeon]|nr:hypothetical protein [Caldisphaeraceae archaeon]